ncbi:MAG: sugar porter family MFS transporter [Calditrichaeota bacterium]|nr:sugar porter family MFS transporter [Calditrichota bacterium]
MKRILYLYSSVAALGGFLFGFDMSVISGTIPFITDYFHLSNSLLGYAVSSALVGCVVGAISVGKPGDIFGRRNVLKAMAALFLISAIGSGAAGSLTVFVIFRFIGGLAVGGASVMSPMYISEISPAKIRGRLVAITQLAIVIGALTAFFSNYLLVDLGTNNWRWMFWAEGVPALAFFILLFSVSPSPRWLVKVDRIEEARSVVRAVNHGGNVGQIINDIIQSINKEAFAKSVILFKKPYLRLVLIGIAVGMFNQFTGINVVFYYAPSLFKAAGFGNESALMQTVMVGATNLIFTVIAMSFIDKLGRKFLLIVGALGMPIFLGLFAAAFLKQSFAGYQVLIYLIGFVAFFASSQGLVIWVILSEMFPNNIRSRASSIGTFSHWFFNALTSFLFPIAAGAFGIGYIFIFYTIATLVSLLFFIKFLDETKGKTLEELERIVLK